jgi:hypothetical protein
MEVETIPTIEWHEVSRNQLGLSLSCIEGTAVEVAAAVHWCESENL